MIAILVSALGLHMGAIRIEAEAAGVPPDVLAVICYYETRGEADRARAEGPSGEIGICQVRPETALRMGAGGLPNSLLNPEKNIRMAARWLAHCAGLGAEAVRQLAHCYNEGRFTGTSKTPYASRVADMVMALRMEAALFPQVALLE